MLLGLDILALVQSLLQELSQRDPRLHREYSLLAVHRLMKCDSAPHILKLVFGSLGGEGTGGSFRTPFVPYSNSKELVVISVGFVGVLQGLICFVLFSSLTLQLSLLGGIIWVCFHVKH